MMRKHKNLIDECGISSVPFIRVQQINLPVRYHRCYYRLFVQACILPPDCKDRIQEHSSFARLLHCKVHVNALVPLCYHV